MSDYRPTPADFARFRTDPAAFRSVLLIDCGDAARRFGDVVESWQVEDFAALDRAVLRVCGYGHDDAPTRAWIERPRGHSKTLDLAVLATWLLIFPPRLMRGVVGAGDVEQAQLVRDAIARLVSLNPWLAEFVEVQRTRVVAVRQGLPGCGSELAILSSDAATTEGITPDWIVCDELAHWPRRALWHTLLSSAAKRPNALLVVISNAGATAHWSWQVRESARTSDRWHFSTLDGPRAAWITAEVLEEQRRMLPPEVYDRLWLNRWVSGGGDHLSATEIEAAIRLPKAIGPRSRTHGRLYVAGLDLSIRGDDTAFVMCEVDGPEQALRVVRVTNWTPRDFENGEILFAEIEHEVRRQNERYLPAVIYADPFQAVGMSQRLAATGMPVALRPMSAGDHHNAAVALLHLLRERMLETYPDDLLLGDLRACTVAEKTDGKFKIELPRDGHGHCDRLAALLLLVAPALASLQRWALTGTFDDAAESAGQWEECYAV